MFGIYEYTVALGKCMHHAPFTWWCCHLLCPEDQRVGAEPDTPSEWHIFFDMLILGRVRASSELAQHCGIVFPFALMFRFAAFNAIKLLSRNSPKLNVAKLKSLLYESNR